MIIRIFQNLYTDLNPARNQELQHCFEMNRRLVFGNRIVNAIKINLNFFEDRKTYNQLFAYANEQNMSRSNDGNVSQIISVFANSDIYFDDTIWRLLDIDWNKHTNLCLALSRWDVQPDGSSVLFNHADSQDTWIFKGYIPQIPEADFFMGGIAGCDNKIALLLEKSGYRVMNPCHDIKTHHLHLSNVRNYIDASGNVTHRLPPPYKLVQPCHLSDI